jgi:hypothetical protein
MAVPPDIAAAAVLVTLKAGHRRFRYADAGLQLATCVGFAFWQPTVAKLLYSAELHLLAVLDGRLSMPSTNDWAAVLLARLHTGFVLDAAAARGASKDGGNCAAMLAAALLVAQEDEDGDGPISAIRKAAPLIGKVGELVAACVPASPRTPPRTLATTACALGLAALGLLCLDEDLGCGSEDWLSKAHTAGLLPSSARVRAHTPPPPPCGGPGPRGSPGVAKALAWAAECDFDTLRADVVATLYAATGA